MAKPKKYNILLTDDKQKMLKSVMRKKQTTKTVRNRCQIIIDLNEARGKILTHEQSAKTNCVCMATITNTVKRYSEKRLRVLFHSTVMLIPIIHAGNLMDVHNPYHRDFMQSGTGRAFPPDSLVAGSADKIALDVPVSKDTIDRLKTELSAWEIECIQDTAP